MRRWTLLLLLLASLLGCSRARPDLAGDRAQLLALHEQALRAHREQNVALLFENSAEDFVLVSRGSVSTPSKAQRTEFLGPYLARTKFSVYRDTVDPIVKISQDGTLGWVIVRIEAKGVQTTAKGEEPLEFISAWISLYEKRDGQWVSVGNVSNFKN